MSTTPLVFDLESLKDPTQLQPKATYAGDKWQGQPFTLVDENTITLSADKKVSVAISEEFGINISGKMSFSAMPDQISVGGGYWTINPLVTSNIPSTTPTPVPWLVPATPRLLKAKDDLSSANNLLLSNSDAQ